MKSRVASSKIPECSKFEAADDGFGLGARERFGEEISKLVVRVDVNEIYDLVVDGLANKVSLDVDVLASFVMHGIVGECNGALVVLHEGGRTSLRVAEFCKKSAEPDCFLGSLSCSDVLSFHG